jgi:hypothetical protein
MKDIRTVHPYDHTWNRKVAILAKGQYGMIGTQRANHEIEAFGEREWRGPYEPHFVRGSD